MRGRKHEYEEVHEVAMMHYLLALKIPASIQGKFSIAKGQYRDIEHRE